MKKELTRPLTRGGVIAALYVILTVSLGQLAQGLALGPVFVQFRPAEALTVLPILFPEAVPALFIGVLIANAISQFGWIDMVFGSLLTLVAAYVTRRTRTHLLAWFSPVIFNALGVSIYIAYFITNQWWTSAYWLAYFQQVLSIGISEALVVFGLGLPLIAYLRKNMFGEY
ncbi:MAG TPA: QueT transporter family protein [Syntrophomonas sp.]|nr:QueT transporter family protein [Syntrophomonas sp.]